MPVWEIVTAVVVAAAAGVSAFAWRRYRAAIFLVAVPVAAWLSAYAFGLPVRVAVTAAAYGAIGVLAHRSRKQLVRVGGMLVAVGVPLIVTLAEIASDSSSIADALFAILIAAGWIAAALGLWQALRERTQAGSAPVRTTKIVAIVNPSKFSDGGEALRRALRSATTGMGEPLWVETSVDDPGSGPAGAAVADGADLVIACGGDGTVRACADGLAGSGIPLGIVPSGTGNLLARNLGIPFEPGEALKVVLSGANRMIDLGRVDDQRFAVMAGIGFDAALVASASEQLKRQVGWPAYVVSGMRHLRGEVMRLTISLDDAPELVRRARGVLIGNVGRIQGGIPILPDAAPDDGLLDVIVLAPRGLLDWVRVGVRVLARRRGTHPRIERYTAKKVAVRTERPHPRQLDGESIAPGRTFDAEIEAAALVVRVPRPPAIR